MKNLKNNTHIVTPSTNIQEKRLRSTQTIVYIRKSVVDPSLLTETNTPFTEQCFVRKFTRSDNLTYDVHLSHQNTDSLRGECVLPFHIGASSAQIPSAFDTETNTHY